ncbi:MAG: histidine kinase [Leptolyngbya sp. SIO4C1]|nr:histidine kinase [Leptolyngbya sp. SIO4C1]
MATPKAPGTYEKHLATLGQLLQSIWEADELEVAVNAVIEYIKTHYDYQLIWVGTYSRFKHQLVTKGASIASGEYFARQQIALQPGDLMEQVVVQQRPIVVASLQEEARAGEWSAIAEKLELQAAAIWPIRYRDICFGILVLGAQQWGITPTILERSTLMTVVNAIGQLCHQNDIEQQRQRIKQPAKPFLSLLEQLEQASSLDERLQLIVKGTQAFITPSRTSVYWFENKARQFWQRLNNRQLQQIRKSSGHLKPVPPPAPIAADQVKGFYQALCNDELVVLGEAESSLKTSLIGRLMSHLQAQSLMAAPILFHGELKGFLSVEGSRARVWSGPEKQYLQGAARLISLSMPASEMEQAVAEIRSNQLLTAGVTRSIHGNSDWEAVMRDCAEQLMQQTRTTNLLVLVPDFEKGGFEIAYQGHQGRTISIRSDWRPLHDLDWRLLEHSSEPILIENLEDDLKLVAWRPRFLEMGARAVMACNVSPGRSPEGIILVADVTSRRWSKAEIDLLKSVSQQIGLILHQWQLQQQANQQEQLHETMQWGLRNLQRIFQPEALEKAATHHISQLLQAPLVSLVVWEPGQAQAKIADTVVREQHFFARTDRPIPVASDAIINWAIQTDGVLPLNLEDLPDVTRQWLYGPHACQILLMALRTAPEHEPSGVIVLADHSDRRWSDQQMNMLAILVNQLAWCRRHLQLNQHLTAQKQQLAELNWYKQHQISDLKRLMENTLQQLNTSAASLPSKSNQLQQLQDILSKLTQLAEQERWDLQKAYQTMPLVTLLNRLMDRVNPAVQANQLWTKVHCESNLTVGGDIQKIEFILFELIASACERSPSGGRIDIWARQLDRRWLELSITDNGTVDERIVAELNRTVVVDVLANSALSQPPGLHFRICQSLMEQLGGEFVLQPLEDQRTLSRVILPLGKLAKRRLNQSRPSTEALLYSSAQS